MNYSLVAADRMTHLKIVVVAVIASVTVVVGISARLGGTEARFGRIDPDQPVVSASKPLSFTGRYRSDPGAM